MTTFERRLIIRLARILMERGKAQGWSHAIELARQAEPAHSYSGG